MYLQNFGYIFQKQDNLSNDKIVIVDNIKTSIQDEQTIATFFVPLMEINHAITDTFFYKI